ncbi:Type-2 restriction enzyme Sau3AI [Spiroplasma sp. JKS002669]|nr:Type-2 restriction enzyme Sau3AI [Spiroplasma sp. JKS002669]
MELETEEQVIKMAESLKNKSVNQIIKEIKWIDNDVNLENKGYVGNIIESYFGIKRNNFSKPDLHHLGIEIKSTPLKKLKNKEDFSIKERMVLNIINFNQENLNDFYQSSFFKKNKKILMVYYLFNDEILDKDYFIHNFIYHDLSKIPLNDLNIIKNDWQIIANKIKMGKAHQLSERLTKYLGACPKGNTKNDSLINQPFSDIKAMRRAYSFKPHYLKYLLIKDEYKDKLPRLNIIENKSVINFVFQKIVPFINLNVKELCKKFNINYKRKDVNYALLKSIFNVKNFNYIEEFLKENIKIRTYTIKSNNTIQEEFPFNLVNPYEFENNNEISFYDSELYNYFINTKFIFIGFKKDENNTYISKISSFEFPETNINDLKLLWEDTRKKFQGDIVISIKKTKNGKLKTINNLISKKDGYIGHIRPKAQDRNNQYLIPCGKKITRQCYWLNKEFVQKYFKDLTEELN